MGVNGNLLGGEWKLTVFRGENCQEPTRGGGKSSLNFWTAEEKGIEFKREGGGNVSYVITKRKRRTAGKRARVRWGNDDLHDSTRGYERRKQCRKGKEATKKPYEKSRGLGVRKGTEEMSTGWLTLKGPPSRFHDEKGEVGEGERTGGKGKKKEKIPRLELSKEVQGPTAKVPLTALS